MLQSFQWYCNTSVPVTTHFCIVQDYSPKPQNVSCFHVKMGKVGELKMFVAPVSTYVWVHLLNVQNLLGS